MAIKKRKEIYGCISSLKFQTVVTHLIIFNTEPKFLRSNNKVIRPYKINISSKRKMLITCPSILLIVACWSAHCFCGEDSSTVRHFLVLKNKRVEKNSFGTTIDFRPNLHLFNSCVSSLEPAFVFPTQ